MFALKKLVASLLLPLPAALCLLAVAIGLGWFTQRRRTGNVLVLIAFALLLLFSTPFVANALLAPLERGQEALYPAERLIAATTGAGRHPRWVVVLGAGHVTDPQLPALDQLTSSALFRLAEGVRLYRELPGTKLLLSGGVDEVTPHAEILGQAAVAFGVPEHDLVLERSTVSTEDEAIKLTAIVGKDDFILVTSASHMPRALSLFRACGVDPIAAPTDHLVRHDAAGLGLGDVFPHASGLARAGQAEHEYLGRLWASLRGRI